MNIVNEQTREPQVWVEFYKDAEHSIFQSEAKGYPVFVDKTYCRLTIPGDTQQVSIKEVKGHEGEQLKRQYAQQWAQFEQGLEQSVDGFPLEQWPQITRSQVETLKALKFRTVEQLANASDTQLQRVGMGSFELRIKAQTFIKAAEDGALASKQAAELDRQNKRIAELEAQIQAIANANEAPKRGRKGNNDATGNSSDGL